MREYLTNEIKGKAKIDKSWDQWWGEWTETFVKVGPTIYKYMDRVNTSRDRNAPHKTICMTAVCLPVSMRKFSHVEGSLTSLKPTCQALDIAWWQSFWLGSLEWHET